MMLSSKNVGEAPPPRTAFVRACKGPPHTYSGTDSTKTYIYVLVSFYVYNNELHNSFN